MFSHHHRLKALAIEVAEARFVRGKIAPDQEMEIITGYGEDFAESDIRHIVNVLAPKALDKIQAHITGRVTYEFNK